MKKLWISLLFLLSFAPISASNNSCSSRFPTITFSGWNGSINSLIDGYYVWDGAGCWWTPGVISYHFWQDTPLHYSTRAIWQSEHVMEGTARWKGIDLSDVSGGIAINSCSYDGELAHIRPPNFDWIDVKVVDCVQRLHSYYHSVPVDSALELSYSLADQLGVIEHQNQYGGVGMYGVEVCLTEISYCEDNNVVDYKEWFLENVRFEGDE